MSSKQLVFIRCTGHSGSAWLQQILNQLNNVNAWGEINRRLFITYKKVINSDLNTEYHSDIGDLNCHYYKDILPNAEIKSMEPQLTDDEQYKVIKRFIYHQYKTNPNNRLVFIKACPNKILRFANSLAPISIIQIIRHPLIVSNFYYSLCQDIRPNFSDHIKWLKTNQYVNMQLGIDQLSNQIDIKVPIIKLESINESLINNTPYFKKILETILNIKIDQSYIAKIKATTTKAPNTQQIWDSMDKSQQQIFNDNMSEILQTYSYGKHNV